MVQENKKWVHTYSLMLQLDLPRSPCFLSSTISPYPDLKHDLPSLQMKNIQYHPAT